MLQVVNIDETSVRMIPLGIGGSAAAGDPQKWIGDKLAQTTVVLCTTPTESPPKAQVIFQGNTGAVLPKDPMLVGLTHTHRHTGRAPNQQKN